MYLARAAFDPMNFTGLQGEFQRIVPDWAILRVKFTYLTHPIQRILLWKLWGNVRNDPAEICAIAAGFFVFVLHRLLETGLCGKDTDDINSSYLLISTREAVLRYTRLLLVHRKSQLSELSHLTKDDDVMKDAPWTVDLADLAPSLLLFGHTGPGIVDNWSELFAREGQAAVTPEMRDVPRKLSSFLSLSPLQQLMFKPLPDMTKAEIDMLKSKFGTVNPIVQYFQDKADWAKQYPNFFAPRPPQPTEPTDEDEMEEEEEEEDEEMEMDVDDDDKVIVFDDDLSDLTSLGEDDDEVVLIDDDGIPLYPAKEVEGGDENDIDEEVSQKSDSDYNWL
ncbi:hypothetical protein R3P38DRAFT_2786387 [Favolaschia claudopus]|uniref:Uncharacterized protein n=1 Tax=Favolaschia claudopus TaxID=2862362 RepID=A0AAW0AS83_9AGAR